MQKEAEKNEAPNNLEADIVKAVAEEPTELKPKSKKSLKFWAILGLVAVLLLIAVGVLYFMLTNRGNQQGEKATGSNIGQHADADSVIIKQQEENKGNEDFVLTEYSSEIIAEHDNIDDCWIVFESEVYDVTQWRYPGETPLDAICGSTNARPHFEADGQNKPPEEYFIGFFNYTGVPLED